MMDYSNLLQKLRAKLGNNQMSVMVGSGFSKNVSPLFPTWYELLLDLMRAQYGAELSREYYNLPPIKRKQHKEEQYIDIRFKELLRQKGYLQVVSDYIREHSIESIATYIEKRTPYVHQERSQILLSMGEIQKSLDFEDLDLHRALIGLGWNNIYTTNYDHLLDICVSEQLPNDLRNEIQLLEKEVASLLLEYSNFEKSLSEIEVKIYEQENNIGIQGTDGMTTSKPDDLEELREKRDKINTQLRNLERQASLKSSQIDKKEKLLNDCFTIVTEASKLKIKRNKNIIKLHGSLRTPKQIENFEFGFDGDHKCQYIISQEDYDQYPHLHEPFTQLMRISLLQESFCLVGFSADDPNFIAWITWVRDVLQRGNKKGEPKEVKIYLIDVNNDKISPDRLLFFENHNIKRIPLQDESLQGLLASFMEKETGQPTYKDYLSAFVSFLADDDNAEPMIPLADTTHISEWQDIWKDRTTLRSEPRQDPEKVQENLRRLKALATPIYIPDIRYTDTQLSFIQFYDNYRLRRYDAKKSSKLKAGINPAEMKLLAFAFKDSMLPLDYAFHPEMKAEFLKSGNNKIIMEEAVGLSNALTGGKKSPDNMGEKIYQLAFNFKFRQLKKKLDQWDAQGIEILQKAGLLSLWDKSKTGSYTKTMLSPQHQIEPEICLYLNELLICNSDWHSQKKLKQIVTAYSKQGFTQLSDNFKYLKNSLKPTFQKIETLGSGRYSISRDDDHWEKVRSEVTTVRFLYLMLYSGTQLSHTQTLHLKATEWLELMSNAYEIYPEAILFYSLQVSERDFCVRIAQEYVSNQKISQQVKNRIAVNLFAAIRSAPERMGDNIISFLSTFLIVVPPEVWQYRFMKEWNRNVSNRAAFREQHRNPFAKLVYAAANYMEDKHLLLQLISDCLSATINQNKEIQLDYTYYIQRNYYYTRISRDDDDFGIIDETISKITGTISEKRLNCFYVLANLNILLTQEQKNEIKKVLALLDFTKISDSRFWEVAIYIADGDVLLIEKVKSVVLISSKLWDTGYRGKAENGRTSWSHADPINLKNLSLKQNRTWGINWSDIELKNLSDILLGKAGEFKLIMRHDNQMFSYFKLSEVMDWFLFEHQASLSTYKNYKPLKELIQSFHLYNSHFDALEDGLTSLEKADVVWALGDLAANFNNKEAEDRHVIMVLNKILFQAEPAVEAALGYMVYWIEVEVESKKEFWNSKEVILSILRKYRYHPLAKTEKTYSDYQLCRIALAFHPYSKPDNDLNWWIEQARNSPYNSIRQLVQRKDNKMELD